MGHRAGVVPHGEPRLIEDPAVRKSRPAQCRIDPRALLVLALLAASAPLAAGGFESDDQPERPAKEWLGPDGDPLPFTNNGEVIEFLKTATIVSSKEIGQGINRSHKVLLDRDGVRAHAVFRTVDLVLEEDRYARGTMRRYRDSYVFEPAAYELNQILEIDRVPPAVERNHEGEHGSLQAWVENGIDEGSRIERDLEPPDPEARSRQQADRLVFDALIHNFDRNTGNLIYDQDWNLWLIDHTRSFAPDPRLLNQWAIEKCTRELWNSLSTIDRDLVESVLEPYLTRREMKQLFFRWKQLVKHLQGKIDELGDDHVLLD